MNKLKVYIITLCLILSTLFTNISGVYCANTFNYFLYFYPVEGYEHLYVNNTIELIKIYDNTIISYELSFDDVNDLFYADVVLENNTSYTYNFYSDGELIESGSLMGQTNKYIYVHLTKIPVNTNPPEDTESSESTENTESTEGIGSTEIIVPDVNIDMTETNNKLDEIQKTLLMFFTLFAFYFGYKIVKEIVFNAIERK